jgi:hypothetical protein
VVEWRTRCWEAACFVSLSGKFLSAQEAAFEEGATRQQHSARASSDLQRDWTFKKSSRGLRYEPIAISIHILLPFLSFPSPNELSAPDYASPSNLSSVYR